MITLKRFKELSDEDKGVLGRLVGAPDFDSDERLYMMAVDHLSNYGDDDPDDVIAIINKLK